MESSRNIFALPPRESATRDALAKLKPRPMQTWAEALPMTNLRATTRALFARADQLASCALPAAALFDSLEVLLGRCQSVAVQIETSLRSKALPFEREDLRVADLIYEMRLKVYLGYKRVLADSHTGGGARRLLHRPLRRRAFHRAQELLLELLRNRYQVYRAVPYFHWLEIHRNFEQARAEGRADRSLPLLTGKQADVAGESVEGLYKHALLLALAGPHRFLPHDIFRLHLALRRWVPECRLERIGAEFDHERAPFVVDVDVDQPPVHASAVDVSRPIDGWYIHTADLAARIAEELGEAEAERGGTMRGRPSGRLDAVPIPLLSSLLLSWGMGARRNVARSQCRRMSRVVLGLDDLYTLLGGIPLPDGDAATGFQMEVVGSGDGRARPAELQWSEELAEFEVLTGHVGGAGSVRIHPFLVCDQGVGGMSLCADDASRNPIHVGELVGVLADPATREISRIGVVRWMRLDKDNRIQCGVELLLDEPRCSQLRITRRNGTQEYMPVIYQLPDEEQNNLLLITKCIYADASDTFCWRLEGEERPLHLSQMLECTGAYSLFQVPMSDGDPDESDSRHMGNHSADYFEEIWDRLR